MPVFKVPGPLNGGDTSKGFVFGEYAPLQSLSSLQIRQPDRTDFWTSNSVSPLAHKSVFESDLNSGICSDLSNRQFSDLVMSLCQQAISLAQSRHAELLRWDEKAKKRTWLWFNSSDEALKGFLLKGIEKTIHALKKLQPEDFVAYTEGNIKNSSCYDSMIHPHAAAAVCPVDIGKKKIMIATRFCGLTRDKQNPYNQEIGDGDSQLLTIVHEVTHFHDVFSATDDFYSTYASIKNVENEKIRFNADSLAAYIIGTNPLRERI
ncbi:M35 family metalloendopeptidase [Comamonas piscis]